MGLSLCEATPIPETITTESYMITTTTPKNITSESTLLVENSSENISSFPEPTTTINTIQESSPSSTFSISDLLNDIYNTPDITVSSTTLQDSLASLSPTEAPHNNNTFLDTLISAIFDDRFTSGIIYAPPTSTIAPAEKISHSQQNLFSTDLFAVITRERSQQNIVYSPASIQTSLALAFMGAEGETADDMRNVLRLGEGEKPEVAKRFGEFLKSLKTTENSTEDLPKLKIVNRLYIKQELNVSEEFNYFAKKYFDTQTERTNFSDSKTSLQQINNWVEQQTENKIKNLMSEDSLSATTNAVLINAIYFKAKWLNPFSLSSTSTAKFYLNLNETQEAHIMYNEEYYNYIELPELEATALEMPFENSNLSMLIILPNEIRGLEDLELKLSHKDLNEITSKMQLKKVHAYIPRFTIEFDIDLKEPLEKVSYANLILKDIYLNIYFTDGFSEYLLKTSQL